MCQSSCDSFTSYHTTQIFSIGKRITCQSTGLIYLAECITCISNLVQTDPSEKTIYRHNELSKDF